MYEVMSTDEADRHLEQIVDYFLYDVESTSALDKVLDSFDSCYQKIALFPYMFPVCDERYMGDPNDRKAVLSKYIIIYSVNDEQKTIYIEGIHRTMPNMDYTT